MNGSADHYRRWVKPVSQPPRKTAVIIPARLSSSRLPRKMLLAETGKPLIQHTYEAALRLRDVDLVVVATGDYEIKHAVESFGGKVIVTDPSCPTGTERVRRAAKQLPAEFGYIVNVQGDEPELSPTLLEPMLSTLRQDQAGITTLAAPVYNHDEFNRPSVVKVVVDEQHFALYFSRAPIPYNANGYDCGILGLRHVGIYGFKREILDQLEAESPSLLEGWERLEQLGWLEAGWRICVCSVSLSHPGIDTPADYAHFVRRWQLLTGTDLGIKNAMGERSGPDVTAAGPTYGKLSPG